MTYCTIHNRIIAYAYAYLKWKRKEKALVTFDYHSCSMEARERKTQKRKSVSQSPWNCLSIDRWVSRRKSSIRTLYPNKQMSTIINLSRWRRETNHQQNSDRLCNDCKNLHMHRHVSTRWKMSTIDKGDNDLSRHLFYISYQKTVEVQTCRRPYCQYQWKALSLNHE